MHFGRTLGIGGIGGVLFAALLASACSWAELDAVRRSDDPLLTAPDGPSEGEAAEASAPDSAVSTPSPLACTTGAPVFQSWTFDTTSENWALSENPGVQGTLAWTGGVGDPSPGVLQADIDPAAQDAGTAKGAWIRYDGSLGNLTGRTIAAWVLLDSGAAPHFKVYVQTGTEWVWADNGNVALTPHVWTCVSLPVSTPAYNGDNYDPTNVVRVGFETLGTEPFRLYVDSVRYY